MFNIQCSKSIGYGSKTPKPKLGFLGQQSKGSSTLLFCGYYLCKYRIYTLIIVWMFFNLAFYTLTIQ